MEPRLPHRQSSDPASPPVSAAAARADAKLRIARGTHPEIVLPRPNPRDAMWRDPWVTRLGRRALTYTGTVVLTGIYTALLPLLLTYSLVADVVQRKPMLRSRFHLTIVSVLWWHVIGLICLALFLLAWPIYGRDPENWWQWNRKLEGWWGSWVIGIPELLYGMNMEVTGDENLRPGPVLILARHTSVIDTMLPLRVLEYWHKMIARIVKKQVLLFDPCVDGISHRIPRTFVKREKKAKQTDLEHIRKLTLCMGEDDGLWMFPEGTRFSPKKREQILDKLRERHPEAAERAESLRYTLPPRPAGTLELLQVCDGMDVVFCAHTGMEGANALENFIGGSLYRRTIKIEFWRVPASDIPAGDEQRLIWLHSWWERIDRWVEAHQDPDITEMLANE